MPVSFKDILEAFEFVNFGGTEQFHAFLCRQSGKIYWHSESFGDFGGRPSEEFEELPDDIEPSAFLQRLLGFGAPQLPAPSCGSLCDPGASVQGESTCRNSASSC